MQTAGDPIIRLEGVSKAFGDVQANRDISLSIQRGSVLALLGENGAGKSTLMSILAGQIQPDSGRIFLNGQLTRLSTTEEAIGCGIGMVYQHFKLVEAMTVSENVLLGQTRGLWINRQKMAKAVEALIHQYGMSLRPESRVDELSMGEKQQVEILRLLYRQSEILIFDEPTAVLTPVESERLFAAMQRMRDRGKALVFISHKLEEVMAVADSIAILKRGQVIDQMAVGDVASPAELARRMVGRPVLLQVDREPMEPRQTVLQVRNLSGSGLKSINLELRKGEIVALVGVAGNGQKPLVETICGLRRPQEGTIQLLGKDWRSFFRTRDAGQVLSYIPEDRQGLATCAGLDLLDNFLLTTRGDFYNGPVLQRKNAAKKARELLATFDVRPPDLKAQARQLSGGNLQKLVLAREFHRKPRLIVAEQPTQGLDIAAAEDVWQLLLKAREQAGILLVTGDLAEALALADRIGVMFAGALVGMIERDDEQGIKSIAQLMAGLTGTNTKNDAPEEGL